MWFNDDEYDETSSANTSGGSPTPTTPNGGATNSPASNSGSPLTQQQLTPRPDQLQQNGVLGGGASAGVAQTNLNDELKDSSAGVLPAASGELADAVCPGANGAEANGADKDEDARSQSPGSAAKKVKNAIQ